MPPSENERSDAAANRQYAIVIDGFPNTGKSRVAEFVAEIIGRDRASVTFDSPSEQAFAGGLGGCSSVRSALQICRSYRKKRWTRKTRASSKSAPYNLRSAKQFRVMVRDLSSTLYQTRAHLSVTEHQTPLYGWTTKNFHSPRWKQNANIEHASYDRVLRYYLVVPFGEACRRHLELFSHKDREQLQSKVETFTRVLGLEMMRETDGLFIDLFNRIFDGRYSDRKLVHHDWMEKSDREAFLTAYEIACDVSRELRLPKFTIDHLTLPPGMSRSTFTYYLFAPLARWKPPQGVEPVGGGC